MGRGTRNGFPLPRGLEQEGCGRPGQRKERGRGGHGPGLGPTGVSGGSPGTKDQGGRTTSAAWPPGPSMAGWGTHTSGPQALVPDPRAVPPPAGGSATACPTRAPRLPRTAVPALPGLPCRARDPWHSRERGPRRAFPGLAWRPRGAQRRRGPSPWRPEEAAVCAARRPRTKRGAPLPAIVRPRPPRRAPGPPGTAAGNTRPVREPGPAPAGPRLPHWPPSPFPTDPGSECPSRTCSSWRSSLNAGGRRGGPGPGHFPIPSSDPAPPPVPSPGTPLSALTFCFPARPHIQRSEVVLGVIDCHPTARDPASGPEPGDPPVPRPEPGGRGAEGPGDYRWSRQGEGARWEETVETVWGPPGVGRDPSGKPRCPPQLSPRSCCSS